MEQNSVIEQKDRQSDGRKSLSPRLLAIVLLFFVTSFLGWCMEKTWFLLVYHSREERGFLSLPLCPIYGGSLLAIRFLFGLPAKEGEKYPCNLLRVVLYAVLSSIVATLAELFTGLYFDRVHDLMLWSYRGEAHQWGGYICLPMSVGWGFLIAAGMGLVWSPLENALSRLSVKLLLPVDVALSVAVFADFVCRIAAL